MGPPAHPLARGAVTGLLTGLVLAAVHTAVYAALGAWHVLTRPPGVAGEPVASLVALVGVVSFAVGAAVGTGSGWLVGAALGALPRLPARLTAAAVVLVPVAVLTVWLPEDGAALPFRAVAAVSGVGAAAVMAWRAPHVAADW